MRLLPTGSAPISANVMEFLKIGLLCEVLEGMVLAIIIHVSSY